MISRYHKMWFKDSTTNIEIVLKVQNVTELNSSNICKFEKEQGKSVRG